MPQKLERGPRTRHSSGIAVLNGHPALTHQQTEQRSTPWEDATTKDCMLLQGRAQSIGND
ncbi:hypothetical protein BSZ22_31645 [Bradyrhizobium canariense]|nr:hypothetical protein BSZ22_31645 [Bradyrhizobium canariense]OSI75768.1 hypothetical protein BSZ23_26995 [Bradyrhizobium canariense]OSI85524.1 hypothetical protein BSZ24_31125 [Bradyrhizobium canariense]OSI87109.1 hypothetical protein BSZ25_28575 [Bradyrhizobium canariense]